MKYLLDTHVLLWALEDNSSLSEEVRNILLDENNIIYLSVISLFEISIKHKKHPELMRYSAEEIINYSMRAGYVFLSLSSDSIMCHERFDYGTHQDPFDQILIAQSNANDMKLITHDEAINKINPSNTFYF